MTERKKKTLNSNSFRQVTLTVVGLINSSHIWPNFPHLINIVFGLDNL